MFNGGDTYQLQMLAAAYMCADGISNVKIARKLKIGADKVRRLLDIARQEGLLVDRPILHFSRNQLAWVEDHLFGLQLRENLKQFAARSGVRPIRDLRIHRGPAEPATDARAYDVHLAHFAPMAATRVAELFAAAKLVGTPWGSTMAAFVQAMQEQGAQWMAGNPRLRFFPLCGESLAPLNPDYGASSIALSLQQIVQPGLACDLLTWPLSLVNTTALIPEKLGQAGKDFMRACREQSPAYREIFGIVPGAEPSGEGLIDQMDAVITSVSSPSQPLHMYSADLERLGVFDREKLRSLSYGDLCGTLIKRRGLSDRQEQEFEEMQSYWAGAQYEHLVRCAERAHRDPKCPGVIVLAIGAGKAELIVECCRLGLISELCSDHHLAIALDKLLIAELGSESARERGVSGDRSQFATVGQNGHPAGKPAVERNGKPASRPHTNSSSIRRPTSKGKAK